MIERKFKNELYWHNVTSHFFYIYQLHLSIVFSLFSFHCGSEANIWDLDGPMSNNVLKNCCLARMHDGADVDCSD